MTSMSTPPDANASLSLSERLRLARNNRRASYNNAKAATEEDAAVPSGNSAHSKSNVSERYRPAAVPSDTRSAVGSQVSNTTISSAEGSTRSWRNIHALVQKLDETVETNRGSSNQPSRSSQKTFTMSNATSEATASPQPAWKYRNLHTITSKDSKSEDYSAHSSTASNSTQPTDLNDQPVPSVVVQPSKLNVSKATEATNFSRRWNSHQQKATEKSDPIKLSADMPKSSEPVRRKWAPPATQESSPATVPTKSTAPAAPHTYVPVTHYSFVPPPPVVAPEKSPRGEDHSSPVVSLGTSYSFASQASSSRRSESPRKASSPPSSEGVGASRSIGSPTASHGVVEKTVAPSWKKKEAKPPELVASPVPAWKKKLQEQRKLQEEQRQQEVKVASKWKKKAEDVAPDITSLPSDEADVSKSRFSRGNHTAASAADTGKTWFARTHPSATTEEKIVTYPSAAGVPSEETISPEKDDPAEKLGIGETITSLSPQLQRLRREAAASSNGSAAVNRPVNKGGWESPRTAILKAKEEQHSSTAASYPTRTFSKGPVPFPNQKPVDSASSGKYTKPVSVPKASPSIPIDAKDVASNDAPNKGDESEDNKKVSVAEMKAKLWGGKSEKPLVPSKAVGSSNQSNDTRTPSFAASTFSSPVRPHSSANSTSFQAVASPPKPVKSKTPVASPVLPPFTRGRPDVCTPNGPLPPPRGSQAYDPPPRKNMDTLWMRRMEQAAKNDDSLEPLQLKVDGPSGDVCEETTEVPHTNICPDTEDSPPPPPPLAEQANHHRSPSIGDFQIASNSGKKVVIEEGASYEVASPPVSPRMGRVTDPISPTIRPTVMPKWDSPIPKSGSTSPNIRPPKLPPSSPVPTEVKERACFVETIDCPPLDDYANATWGLDPDITGPKEATEPVSPRPKQPDRPWTKDSTVLSPNSWRKTMNPVESADMGDSSQFDPSVDQETLSEEKKCADSPTSSLVKMAADSIHAVEYEKAVRGLQRKSLLEDDDDESVQSVGAVGSSIPAVVPPEFENAIAHTSEVPTQVPVFGDPVSFGAAGGEKSAVPALTVADRAKAIASWNGGLGAAPSSAPVDLNVLSNGEIASSLSPIRHETSDTEIDGMSPRLSKRGFGIEDWKRNKSFDSRSEHETSSDFWQPSTLDHPIDDKDWSKCDPELEAVAMSISEDVSKATVDASSRLPAPRKSGTPPLLSKPKSDTDPKPKMTWRKKPLIPKSESSTPPKLPVTKSQIEAKQVPSTQPPSSVWKDSAIKSTENVAFEAFDPFEYSFNGGEKVEFTDATEFTENTDMFESLNGDPFVVASSSFLPFEPKLVAPPSGGDDGYEEDSDSIPNIASLARPSGSSFGQYELWSYDADTSGLHEGAAEI